MYSKKTRLVCSVVTFFILTLFAHAQRCSLGISEENIETISMVFQLNEEQIKQLETLSAAFAVAEKAIEDEVQLLFNTHPQSTPKELTQLAEKYKVLEAKMVTTSLEFDKKLLQAFNDKQYERYISLCKEANRSPIALDPVEPDER